MDLDFNKLGSEANAMLESDNTPAPETPVTPTPAVSQPASVPVTSTQPSVTPTPAIPGQVSPAEEKLQLDFGNGKTESLTRAEIAQKLLEAERSGLRQSDYTRKTQEIAQARAEALKVYEQVQQMQRDYEARLNNPQALLEEAQRRIAANQPIDPTKPMTMAEGIQLAQAMREELKRVHETSLTAVQEREKAAQQYVEDRLAVENYSTQINRTLNGVYEKHPVLKVLPEMESVIRFKVAQLEPTTIEETQKAFETVGAQIANDIAKQFQVKQQAAEAARAQLAATGIEPPGGVAPQVSKPDFTAKGGRDLDWSKLKDAALSVGNG